MGNLYSQFTYDDNLELKDSGELTSSEDGDIVDIGAGLVDGFLVIDVTDIKTSDNDEKYTISLEASNVAAMNSGSVCLATKVFGTATAPMDADLEDTGRFVIPFRNEENGTTYRYVRLSTVIAGTSESITFRAFIAKR